VQIAFVDINMEVLGYTVPGKIPFNIYKSEQKGFEFEELSEEEALIYRMDK
jgi:hypothetical protein